MEKNKDDILDASIEDELSLELSYNEENVEIDQLEEIEIKLQEMYVRLDSLSIILGGEDWTDEEMDEYNSLKKEIKILEKEKKNLKKERRASEKKGVLDQISVWIIIYGIIMTIICLPFISYSIWMGFTSFLIDTFSSLINSIDKEDGFLYYTWLGLLAYALPLLLNLLSLELYINFCKTKVDKWGFRIVWIIQALLCLGMMIYLGIHLFG